MHPGYTVGDALTSTVGMNAVPGGGGGGGGGGEHDYFHTSVVGPYFLPSRPAAHVSSFVSRPMQRFPICVGTPLENSSTPELHCYPRISPDNDIDLTRPHKAPRPRATLAQPSVPEQPKDNARAKANEPYVEGKPVNYKPPDINGPDMDSWLKDFKNDANAAQSNASSSVVNCQSGVGNKCSKCNEGYELQPAPKGSTVSDICKEEVTCPRHVDTNGGMWTFSPNKKNIKPGTTATLSCPEGTMIWPEKSHIQKCEADGTWNEGPYKPSCSACVIKDCAQCIPGKPRECIKCKDSFTMASDKTCYKKPIDPPTSHACRDKFGTCNATICPKGMHVCRNCRGLKLVNYHDLNSLSRDALRLYRDGSGAWKVYSLSGGYTYKLGKIRPGAELVAIKDGGAQQKWESDLSFLAAKAPLPQPIPGTWPPQVPHEAEESRLIKYFDTKKDYTLAFRPPPGPAACSDTEYQCRKYGKYKTKGLPSPEGCALANMCKPGQLCCCKGRNSLTPCDATQEEVTSTIFAPDFSIYDDFKEDMDCRHALAGGDNCVRQNHDMSQLRSWYA